jgi:hypothetical protein
MTFHHPEYGIITIDVNNFGNGGGRVTSPIGNKYSVLVLDWTFYHKSDRFFIDRDHDTLQNYLLLLPRSRAALERTPA